MRKIDLVPLSPMALAALGGGDLETANRNALVAMGPYFVSAEAMRTWRRRAAQVISDPASAPWITRIIVDRETGVAVGKAGFHGPPDDDGMVEVGYAVDPVHQRRGYARAALVELLRLAKAEASVRKVRASIAPSNLASRGLVEQYGFTVVGEQWDEEDGLEMVLELALARGRQSADPPRP